MESKSKWRSRMLWLNGALTTLAIVVAAIDPERLPVDTETQALIVAALGVLNMYLRLRTNQPLR